MPIKRRPRLNLKRPELVESAEHGAWMENVKRLRNAGFPWNYAKGIARSIEMKHKNLQRREQKAGEAELAKLAPQLKAIEKIGKKYRGPG